MLKLDSMTKRSLRMLFVTLLAIGISSCSDIGGFVPDPKPTDPKPKPKPTVDNSNTIDGCAAVGCSVGFTDAATCL